MDIDTETLIAGLLCLGYVLAWTIGKGWILKTKLDQQRRKMGFRCRRANFFHINDHSIPDAWYCVNS